MFDLTGRVAIVTGASRGIGRAISLALADRGATLVVTDILTDPVCAFAEELRSHGRTAEPFTLDVTDSASIEAAVQGILEKFGRVDVLVNNAGIARDQLLMRMKREDWDLVIRLNLTGAFACTQAVLRPMLKQRSGRIISISSVVGQMGNAGQSNYAAS
jgi:3-oxoacyl-[acyl-carrier protein] reductase